MVSFQCHSCGDVVKKPKLDQHNARCYAGFDCIDCSKTFNSPGEWKGHTSCISEAEKYQKSLYKGPKTGEQQQYKNNYTTAGSVDPGRGRGGPIGNRGGRGGGYSNGWQKDRSTGANTTPLGTPARLSPPIPVPSPVDDTPSTSQPKVVPPSKQPTTEIVQEAVPKGQGKEKRKDESKKRKSPAPEEELTTSAEAEPAKKAKLPEPGESFGSKPEKKKKKASRKEEEISDKNEGQLDGEMSKKDKKGRKKGKKPMAVDPSVLDDSTAVNGDGDRAAETKEGQSGEVELVANEEGKSKKRKRSKADQNPVPADDGTAGDPEKKGKAKDTSLVNTQAEGEKAEKKSKKGKAVAEVPSEAVQANVAALDPETHEAKASIDSKKKRKRSHVDEVDAPHTEPSPKEKKSKKSKKTSKRSDDPQSEAAILGDSNAIPDSKSVSGGDMKVKKDKKSKKDKKAETAASAA